MLSIHVLKYFSLNEKSLSSLIQSMVHISYKKTEFQRKHSNHLRSNLQKIAVFNNSLPEHFSYVYACKLQPCIYRIQDFFNFKDNIMQNWKMIIHSKALLCNSDCTFINIIYYSLVLTEKYYQSTTPQCNIPFLNSFSIGLFSHQNSAIWLN